MYSNIPGGSPGVAGWGSMVQSLLRPPKLKYDVEKLGII
jgi:hypothetical protein